MAKTFAAPDSVQRIRDIIMRGAETPFTNAALKSLIMGSAAAGGR